MGRCVDPRSSLRKPDIRCLPVTIYALTDPGGVVRYVGKSVAPTLRFWMHISFRASVAVREWVRALEEAKEQPRFVVLEIVPVGADAAAAERAWITRHAATVLNVDGVPGARRRCNECGAQGHNSRSCARKAVA